MTLGHLGGDPLQHIIENALCQLADGIAPPQIEAAQIDVKEEPGRRTRDGEMTPGSTHSEEAASYLAGEMACMANSPGGGAIILGIADDGTFIGTQLSAEWLRHRIWQLTQQQLTVTIRETTLSSTRLLVLTAPEALAPIRYGGKLRWRVGPNCVEIDPVAWRVQSLQRIGYDWSTESSGHSLSDVRLTALEVARDHLRERRTPTSDELAVTDDRSLLTRLGLCDADGRLTNAGSLLFVETPWVGIDYIRREAAGGDSTNRIESTAPLIQQIREAEQAGRAANKMTHISKGFVHSQVRAIPERAFREAIVNGVTHRDWLTPYPTVVEHIGDTLIVTSPGGFIGGVTPENALSHPAVPRYPSLSAALAVLGLAERQGVGIDRMVSEMLSIGRPTPVISEIEGPYVRVALFGGAPDTEVVEFIADLTPPSQADVDTLLLLDLLCSHGWLDADTAASALQRPPSEAVQAILRLREASIGEHSVIVTVQGVPVGQSAAYRLSDEARSRLSHRCAAHDTPAGRDAMFVHWANARGRISSAEAADLGGISPGYANRRLFALSQDGEIAPARQNMRGRGFHYVSAADQR